MEELLAYTINTAHAMKAVDARELSRVIVDTTVQEKAIAHPTDNRLLEVARKKLVLLAKRHGIALRQSDARQGPASGSPYEFGVKERRQAVEPVIGHLKQDCRLNRCHLKGAQGDALHVLGCAAGYNLRWLLRWIAFLRAWLQVVRARSSTSSSTMWNAPIWLS